MAPTATADASAGGGGGGGASSLSSYAVAVSSPIFGGSRLFVVNSKHMKG